MNAIRENRVTASVGTAKEWADWGEGVSAANRRWSTLWRRASAAVPRATDGRRPVSGGITPTATTLRP